MFEVKNSFSVIGRPRLDATRQSIPNLRSLSRVFIEIQIEL